MSAVKKYWPLLILLLVWAVLFRKFFFQGLLPIPSDITVGLYYPWLDYKWGFPAGVPVKNPLLSDIPSLLYPWRIEAINQIKSGHWPLWNPYYFMGMPLLANFQSAVFSYVNLFFLLFRPPIAWSLGVIVSPLLTLVVMYRFLRRRLGSLPSLIGSVVFSLSGFEIAWLEYNVHGHTALFLPLILWTIDIIWESKKSIGLFILPFLVAMQIYTGYIPVAIYSWVVIVSYFVFNHLWPLLKLGLRKNGKTIKRTIILILFILTGVCISSIQFLPGWELTKLSIRKIDPLVEASGASYMPTKNIFTLFAPDFYGNPSTGNYFGQAFYDNFYFFIGTLTLVLIFYSLWRYRNNRQVSYWWCILLFSVVLITNNPLGKLLNRVLLLSGGVAARAVFLFDFSAAILSAYGAEWFVGHKDKRKLLLGIIPLLVLGGVSLYYGVRFIAIPYRIVSIRNLVIPCFVTIVGVTVILFPKLKPSYRLLAIFVLICGQLLYSAGKYLPFTQERLLFPRTPVTDFLVREREMQVEPFRVELGQVIPQNMLMPYEVETTSGYDALLPKSTAQFLSLLENGKVADRLSRVWLINNYGSPYFKQTNTKYILAKKIVARGYISEDGNPPSVFKDDRYRLVFEDKSVQIYQDGQYLPRIESDIEKGTVEWLEYQSGFFRLLIDFDSPGNLVYHSVYFPGWKYQVDGRPVEAQATQSGELLIPVEKGRHLVVANYRPATFFLGVKVTLAGLSLLMMLFVLRLFKKLPLSF